MNDTNTNTNNMDYCHLEKNVVMTNNNNKKRLYSSSSTLSSSTSTSINLNDTYVLDTSNKVDNECNKRLKQQQQQQQLLPSLLSIKLDSDTATASTYCDEDILDDTSSSSSSSSLCAGGENNNNSSSSTTSALVSSVLSSSSSRSLLRNAAKSNLMMLLDKHDGSTKHPDVIDAITHLSTFNPTHTPAKSTSKLLGQWTIISEPDFPNRIKNDDDNNEEEESNTDNNKYCKYTLGRLSFGLFQPRNLICSVVSIQQDIHQNDDDDVSSTLSSSSEEDEQESMITYPITINLIIHTTDSKGNKVDLTATMNNRGICYPKSDVRLGVKFTGGTLCPSKEVLEDSYLLTVWKQTFKDAYTNAEAEKGIVSKIGESLINWMLQLTKPSDFEDTAKNYSFCYEMKRCPMGHLDILYLDNDIRITRGNKGSYVIVRKTKTTQD